MTVRESDRERARRLIWLLLRIGPHETDERMVDALAEELAAMRDEILAAVARVTP